MPLAELSIEFENGQFLEGEAQRAGLVLLGAMLLSFGFIRFSTRMIRAEVSWWPGNVTPGGLHIHHLVFGIVAMMVAGFAEFAIQPESPWLEILAALFGIGVGLTLDEFALWLYLEDVYWSEEGRRSVDAVILERRSSAARSCSGSSRSAGRTAARSPRTWPRSRPRWLSACWPHSRESSGRPWRACSSR